MTDTIEPVVLDEDEKQVLAQRLVADVYDAEVSKDTISRITDKVISEMAEWQTRPLDRVCPVIFIDALVVKVRDGQVTIEPFYVVFGVTTSGGTRHPRGSGPATAVRARSSGCRS